VEVLTKLPSSTTDDELDRLLPWQSGRHYPGVVRGALTVQSIIKNARGFLDLQEEGSDFSGFLWSFVENSPIQNNWRSFDEVPVTTPESEAMSRALKRADHWTSISPEHSSITF